MLCLGCLVVVSHVRLGLVMLRHVRFGLSSYVMCRRVAFGRVEFGSVGFWQLRYVTSS